MVTGKTNNIMQSLEPFFIMSLEKLDLYKINYSDYLFHRLMILIANRIHQSTHKNNLHGLRDSNIIKTSPFGIIQGNYSKKVFSRKYSSRNVNSAKVKFGQVPSSMNYKEPGASFNA